MFGVLVDLWWRARDSPEPNARSSRRLKTEELAGSDGVGGRGRALCSLLRRERIEEALRVTGSMREGLPTRGAEE